MLVKNPKLLSSTVKRLQTLSASFKWILFFNLTPERQSWLICSLTTKRILGMGGLQMPSMLDLKSFHLLAVTSGSLPTCFTKWQFLLYMRKFNKSYHFFLLSEPSLFPLFLSCSDPTLSCQDICNLPFWTLWIQTFFCQSSGQITTREAFLKFVCWVSYLLSEVFT